MTQMLISRRSAFLGSTSRGTVLVADRLMARDAKQTGERMLAEKIAGLTKTLAENSPGGALPVLTAHEARALKIQGPYLLQPKGYPGALNKMMGAG